MINFDHLTPTQFEEFCYDLLANLWYKNLNWRKWTWYKTSPADWWRDIECTLEHQDPDNYSYPIRRYVECKHYKSWIGVSEIYWAVASADAWKSIWVVLVISSYSLSNPAKNRIEEYMDNHRPRFRIRYRENKDIENTIIKYPAIMKKYNLSISI
jgi:hypothetical protein